MIALLSRVACEKTPLTAEKPGAVAFMTEIVVPAMAEAMGEPDFGCAGCHAVERPFRCRIRVGFAP